MVIHKQNTFISLKSQLCIPSAENNFLPVASAPADGTQYAAANSNIVQEKWDYILNLQTYKLPIFILFLYEAGSWENSKSRAGGMFFMARKNGSTVEVKLKGIGSQSFAQEAKVMALFEGILFTVDIFALVTKLLDIVP